MQEITTVVFALVRSAMTDSNMKDTERNSYNEDILPVLFSLAQKHDIAQIVAVGLEKNQLLNNDDTTLKQFSQERMKAVYRYEQLNYELNLLSDAFEQMQIPFIPLKGSVLREYYPEPWYRTSCDIDILVHEEDLDKASKVLVDDLQYEKKEKGSHDVSFFAPSGVHIELHYDLVEDDLIKGAKKVLENVWKETKSTGNTAYEMTDAMFYFYHIAHMAKHFENGGCGIRPFVDLWVLDHMGGAEESKRNALLEQGGLYQFATVARTLSRIWFAEEEHGDLTKQMEKYILRGGVYGTTENRVTVQQQKKGGKAKYLLSKIFLPYHILKFQYPILQKHRWLTPFMQIRRWFKLAFCGHAKRVVKEMKYNRNIPAEEGEKTRVFLKEIGL